MIEIRVINKDNKKDINIKNEPFCIYGEFVPYYKNKKWGYGVVKYDENNIKEDVFQDDNYEFENMKDCEFIGAYEDGKCVGLAIMKRSMFKYMYLYDLKVNKGCRKKGTGSLLIEKCCEIAKNRAYKGIYTIAQNNNLQACLFYIKCGFYIGGFDTNVYKFTKQDGKSDIYFYKVLT